MILALDGGTASLGYAVMRPRSGAVLELGTITSKPHPGVAQTTDNARRITRAFDTLERVARTHGVITIAAEAVSLGGPPKARLSMATTLNLFWGAAIGLARQLNTDLLEVTPKEWQHAVLGRTDKVAYDELFAALSVYVSGQTHMLNAIPQGERNHALDAVGVGLYAALTSNPTRIRARSDDHVSTT
jgi:Holliday junction resolvasome RuvABC endonuclease subunit